MQVRRASLTPVYDDHAPCAVCGSAVELVARAEAPERDPGSGEAGPVGPADGVVGAGDETTDARLCTNRDCPSHAAGGPTS